jgi:hypothetical protein
MSHPLLDYFHAKAQAASSAAHAAKYKRPKRLALHEVVQTDPRHHLKVREARAKARNPQPAAPHPPHALPTTVKP